MGEDAGARRPAAGGARRASTPTACATPRPVWRAALRGLGTGALPSLWDRLGELAMPVSSSSASATRSSRAIASRMAAILPQADVVIVPGTGHAVHLEAPAAVADVIAGDGAE